MSETNYLMNINTSTISAELLSQYLRRYNISKDTAQYILSKLTSEKLQKGEIFCALGKVCDKIGLLMNGLLYASFCPENDIDEKISRFFYVPRNIIVTSFESFSSKKPASESIVALEDSFLLCLSKEDLEIGYSKSPLLERLGRIIAEESYMQASQCIRTLQVMGAKEKIIDFRKTHPNLVNHRSIQVQQIASYLGMHRNIYTKLANKC